MLLELPTELISVIFAVLDKPRDRSRLARACRQLYTVGRKYIWRDIHARLRTLRALRRLNAQLTRDIELARIVRSFDVPIVLSGEFEYDRSPIILKMLPSLSNLRTLVIGPGIGESVPSTGVGIDRGLALLPVFPHLEHLMGPSTAAFAYFARRHSKLIAIHLYLSPMLFIGHKKWDTDQIDTVGYAPLQYFAVPRPPALRRFLLADKLETDLGDELIDWRRPIASSCSIRIEAFRWLEAVPNPVQLLRQYPTPCAYSLHLPGADVFDLEMGFAGSIANSHTHSIKTPCSTKKVCALRIRMSMVWPDLVSYRRT